MEERIGFRTRRVEELFALGFSIGLSIGFLAALFEARRAAERKPATAARMSPSLDTAESPVGTTWWSADSGCRAGITAYGAERRPAMEDAVERHPGDQAVESAPSGSPRRRRPSPTVAPSGRPDQGRTSRRNEGRWPLRPRSVR